MPTKTRKPAKGKLSIAFASTLPEVRNFAKLKNDMGANDYPPLPDFKRILRK